jgi:aminomethyltransferase
MKTPLYPIHTKLKANFTNFHGWEMPLNYPGGILAEVKAVREDTGVFDISHMGRLMIRDKNAFGVLQSLTSNNLSKLVPGRVQYNLLTNEKGGIKDDITIYMFSEQEFMLCVNAGNRRKVIEWLSPRLNLEDITTKSLQIALQGRSSKEIISRFYNVEGLRYYHFRSFGSSIVSKTGYTGEEGYEIYTGVEEGLELFEELVRFSKPCGLGARDVLRIEAGFPLYGNELGEDITPLEASLERFVDMQKEFIGREALLKKKPSRRLCKLLLLERGIPRKGYDILKGKEVVGKVSSGTFSPTIGKGIAMGFVNIELARSGQELSVDIRGRSIPAKVVDRFYPQPT